MRTNPLRTNLICIAVLFVVCFLMLKQAALGERPIGFDHTVHFYKTWLTEQMFLKLGRPFGWSDSWFAGFPHNYTYPAGAYFLVLAIRAVSFGMLSVDQAYAVGFFIAYFLMGYSLWKFGSKAFGPWTALIAAILYLTDRGTPFMGGWFWITDVGVWLIALSISCALMGLAAWADLAETAIAPNAIRAGLWFGFAWLCHPVQLIFLPVSIGTCALMYWINRGDSWVRSQWPFTLWSIVLGLGIGALSLTQFLSTSAYTLDVGMAWKSLEDMTHTIAASGLIPDMWYIPQVLGLFGAVFIVFSRNPLQRTAAILTFLFLLMACKSVYQFFGMYEGTVFQRKLELTRFVMLLKPFWFLSAATLASTLTKTTIESSVFSIRTWRSKAYALVILLVVLPILVPALYFAGKEQVLRNTQYLRSRFDVEARTELVRWLNEQKDKDPRYFRVALGSQPDDHSYVELGCDLRMPIYKLHGTPAIQYAFRAPSDAPEVLRAHNVRYLLSEKARDPTYFEAIRPFGRETMFEFKGWQPERWQVLRGKGSLEHAVFGEEKIEFDVPAPAEGAVMLHVGDFPHWHAYRDGKEVEIRTTQLGHNSETGFITLDLVPGHYQVVFTPNWLDWFGYASSVFLTIGALVALVYLRASPRLGRKAMTC